MSPTAAEPLGSAAYVEYLSMRVHLQHRRKRLYYAGQEFPLVESGGAMIFASVAAAAKVALDEGLTQMQIVVRYAVAPCEITLPVLAEWSNFERKSDPHGASDGNRAPVKAENQIQSEFKEKSIT